jgi:hypothetical protein
MMNAECGMLNKKTAAWVDEFRTGSGSDLVDRSMRLNLILECDPRRIPRSSFRIHHSSSTSSTHAAVLYSAFIIPHSSFLALPDS